MAPPPRRRSRLSLRPGPPDRSDRNPTRRANVAAPRPPGGRARRRTPAPPAPPRREPDPRPRSCSFFGGRVHGDTVFPESRTGVALHFSRGRAACSMMLRLLRQSDSAFLPLAEVPRDLGRQGHSGHEPNRRCRLVREVGDAKSAEGARPVSQPNAAEA
eukprot:scaffold9139_cov64-Phaeocystis_antarctica.AAC.4